MEIKKFHEIVKRIQALRFFHQFDLVVGIARGGIVPAYLVASYLKLPIEFVWINFRDEHHNPARKAPKLLRPLQFQWKNRRILIVDDRSNSGKTLRLAKSLLSGATHIKTFAINGPADYTLFDEECFKMPWDV